MWEAELSSPEDEGSARGWGGEGRSVPQDQAEREGLTQVLFGTREAMQIYAKDHANEPGWWPVGRGPSW